MKFKIITPKNSEIEMEDGQEIVIALDDVKYIISIEKEHAPN